MEEPQKHLEVRSIPASAVVWASVCAAAGLGAAGWLEGVLGEPVAGFACVARAACGVVVVFFVPGAACALWWSRRKVLSLSALLGWGYAANVALLTLATTVIKATGARVTFVNLWLVVAAATLLAAAAARGWARDKRVRNDFAGWGWSVIAGWAAMFVYAGFTVRPFLPSEHDYFSDRDGWTQLAQMAAEPLDLRGRGVRVEFARGWRREGAHRYRFVGREAAVHFHNPGPAFPFRFAAVVQNYERYDVLADFVYAGRLIGRRVAPGRFIRLLYWDNRPSNNVMVVLPMQVRRGDTDLVIRLRRADGGPSPESMRVVLHDFSNLGRRELLRRFSRRFMIGNTDDVRQHFSLARSLLVSLIPVDNTRRYYITDWPLHYYHNSCALALMGDRMETLWVLHWFKMMLVLAVLVRLGAAAAEANLGRWRKAAAAALAALTMMSMTKALPIGDAAAYHDNTEMLCIAGMLLFGLERDWPLFLTCACLASLTQHPTILLVGLLIVVGMAWREDRRALGRCLFAWAAFLVLCLAALYVIGHAAHDWPYWRRRLLSDDNRRFSLLAEAARNPSSSLGYLLERMRAFWSLVLMMSGFLPLFLLGGCRRFSLWAAAATALYLLPVSASSIHRIHYVSLPVMMFAAAGIHAAAGWPRRRFVILAPLCVLVFAACAARLTGASRDTSFTFGHYVLHSSAPFNTLARGRMEFAARLASEGRPAAAIEQLRQAALEDPAARAAAYAGVAEIYERMGDSARAARWRARSRRAAR